MDLAATLFVRAQAPSTGEAKPTEAHAVRIVDLGLGGACVELGQAAPPSAMRAPMPTLPLNRAAFVPGSGGGGGGGGGAVGPAGSASSGVEARRPDLHAWRGDGAAWMSESRPRPSSRATGASTRWPAAAVTARPHAPVAPPSRPEVEVPTDSGVTLEVTAPTLWDPLVLRGRVAWVRRAAGNRPMRAGIRFEHRDASALFALFQLLGAHAYDV